MALVFTVSCTTQMPAKRVPIHESSGNPHLWLPPSQIELEERRARQIRLDDLAEKIGNLYLSHDEIYRYVENLGASFVELANRMDSMEPDIEVAMVQEENNRQAIKQEMASLAKASTRMDEEIKAILQGKQNPSKNNPEKNQKYNPGKNQKYKPGNNATNKLGNKSKNKSKNKLANQSMKYYFSGIENFRDRKYATSIKMFKASLKNKPPAKWMDNIYFGIGIARYQLGQFDLSTASLNRIVEQYPKGDKWLISQVMLGLAYFKNGESSRALYILTKARRNTKSPTLLQMIDQIMDDLEKETLYAAIK